MKQSILRDLEGRLADTPAGEPPADLVARLRADLPDRLELAAGAPASGPRRPPRWLATAAVVVLAVGGGWLLWRLADPVLQPLPGPGTGLEEARGAAEGGADTSASAAAGPTAGRAARAENEGGLAGPAGDQTGPERVALENRQQATTTAVADLATPPPPPPPSAKSSAARTVPAYARLPSAVEVVVLHGDLPVSGATVALRHDDGTVRRGVTAVGGRLRFDDVEPGRHLVRAGLATGEETGEQAIDVLAIGARPVVAFLRIDEGVLAVDVTVRDERGGPLAGATVRLAEGGALQSTGVDGRLSLRLPPGRHGLLASRPGFVAGNAEIEVSPRSARHAVEIGLGPASRGPAEKIFRAGAARTSDDVAVIARPAEKLAEAERRSLVREKADERRPAAVPAPPRDLVFNIPEAAPQPVPGAAVGPVDAAAARSEDMSFRHYGVHPVVDTAEDRLSTFGLDVDTGSWGLIAAFLDRGELPPAAAVRVEEVVNALDYGDPAPARGETFRVSAEGAPTPFAAGPRDRLLRFGIRARTVDPGARRPAALTFVVDVSGSMASGGRLELVKDALGLLLDQFGPADRLAVVAFSDEARVVLPPTADTAAARRAIATLRPEGSTNAEAGLALGYRLAWREKRTGRSNRVVLLSDGVANVGATSAESLLARAAGAAADGIELTTIGVGMGNYDDVLLEQLADRGDGRYAYVDDVGAARRIFVEELAGTLETVAEEARAQVEFDPRAVERWRLLGYENRAIEDHRFRHDDSVDAGEIGAGHTVTALYEVTLVEALPPDRPLAHLTLRWREPDSGRFRETGRRLTAGDLATTWEDASRSLRLTAVAAELAEQLRDPSRATGTARSELAHRASAVAADFPADERAARLAQLAALAARSAGEPGRDD